MTPAWRFGGSSTFSVFSRGAVSTPRSAAFDRLDRLLLRLHDVRQRRVARLFSRGRWSPPPATSRRSVSRPPSTSRVTSASAPSSTTFEAKVPCGQPSRAASICPVWLESSSIACLPRMTRSGFSLLDHAPSAAWRRRAAAVRPRSRPECRGRRRWRARCGCVSWHCGRSDRDGDDLGRLARLLEAHRFLDGDLVERVHRHLDVGELDAGLSALTRILTL